MYRGRYQPTEYPRAANMVPRATPSTINLSTYPPVNLSTYQRTRNAPRPANVVLHARHVEELLGGRVEVCGAEGPPPMPPLMMCVGSPVRGFGSE